MEKRSPHYRLTEIQEQMNTVEAMNLTVSARNGIRISGMNLYDALMAIRALSRKDFYKSMTTHASSRVWQDVYHAVWHGKEFYLKFQKNGEYFVISFKEL
ncbi:MAG: type II toxin-antitoxin system MqsR family toxin [Pseudomonadota bacterium]|nr:type II toxin-antitoxin system MqsR family toxin [Pseudomonadota bacterium]